MNFASKEQMRAVAGSCKHFNKTRNLSSDRDASCGVCKNWDGNKCQIGVFDRVLTSLDQE